MKAALIAYRALVAVARADGHISEDERELLERYRHALGIERETARLAELEPPPGSDIDLTPDERVDVLKMMVRVALADGTLDEREREWLEQVAAQLDIGRVGYGEILVEIESEAGDRGRTRRSLRGVVAALIVVAAVGAVTTAYLLRRGASSEAETGLLRARLDTMTLERAARDEEVVRRSLEGSVGIAAFKQVETRFAKSVVLIIVAYDLVRGDETFTQWSSGTGFFITPDGLIVTNKHVVQPWKFAPEVAARLGEGFVLDRDSLRMGAWSAGSNLRAASGDLDVASGYYNGAGTLEVFRVTEDQLEMQSVRLEDGSIHLVALHALGPGDLALLQAHVAAPVEPFPLPVELPGVEMLDPVMVLGYPRGIGLLENYRAELSVALGQVSKIERSIMITAPVVPGNSGGPVVDRSGHVVGVATLTPGEGLAICLQAAEFLSLLPEEDELLDRASRSVATGDSASALAFVDLAEHREPDPAQRERIEEIRKALAH